VVLMLRFALFCLLLVFLSPFFVHANPGVGPFWEQRLPHHQEAKIWVSFFGNQGGINPVLKIKDVHPTDPPIPFVYVDNANMIYYARQNGSGAEIFQANVTMNEGYKISHFISLPYNVDSIKIWDGLYFLSCITSSSGLCTKVIVGNINTQTKEVSIVGEIDNMTMATDFAISLSVEYKMNGILVAGQNTQNQGCIYLLGAIPDVKSRFVVVESAPIIDAVINIYAGYSNSIGIVYNFQQTPSPGQGGYSIFSFFNITQYWNDTAPIPFLRAQTGAKGKMVLDTIDGGQFFFSSENAIKSASPNNLSDPDVRLYVKDYSTRNVKFLSFGNMWPSPPTPPSLSGPFIIGDK